MKIKVLAKPNSNKAEVKRINETHYMVSVKEPPVKGEANRAILKLLSRHFGVSLSKVRMIHGHTSRNKTIEVVQ
jgi:uncharacterized protein (TIGR00251 family)